MKDSSRYYKKLTPLVEAFQFKKNPELPNPEWFKTACELGIIQARGWKNFLIQNDQEYEIQDGDYIVLDDGRILVYSSEEFSRMFYETI